MKRCVIIGGAPIEDYAVCRAELDPEDFIICCDSGLKHREALGVTPDLVVGDFDSHPAPRLDTETITLPRAKDDTDTIYALRTALKQGFETFLLLGVTGRRLDHTMANLSTLLWLESQGKQGVILDNWSRITVVTPGKPGFVEDNWPYFSLLALEGTARGVTIENAAFPLEQGEIGCEYQYAVSNEPLPGGSRITVEQGRLILMKIREG